jgi:hypothetical protein
MCEKSPFCSTVKNLVACIKTEHFSTGDKECAARPLVASVPENVDDIQSMVLESGEEFQPKR